MQEEELQMRDVSRVMAAGLVSLVLAGCIDGPTATAPRSTEPALAVGAGAKSFIVLGAGNQLPADLATSVTALGGQVDKTIPQIGMAIVSSNDPAFAAAVGKLKGVSDVAEDVMLQWQDPNQQVEQLDLGTVEGALSTTGFGDTETFRLLQWAPNAVNAPAAWNAGYLGAGARVAILDGGIHSTHIDIAPNLDVARSASFVVGFNFNQDVGTFWHGTHVAGIVAARGNGIGTVGIAPAATIIGVKVLHNGSGTFASVIQGILYAATPIAEGGAGANIINMSLGAVFPRQGVGAAQLANALSRASMYARQRGTLVVAAAGNSALDLDHTANLIFVPAQSAGVVAVSSTAPLGFALGATNFDRPASYTNFGQSAIAFAGPGGDFALPGSAVCSIPRKPTGFVTTFCWVFDLVIAPCRGGLSSISSYCFAAGTSMASPAVAGVAALIVGKYGPLPPAQLEARLRASADDLGKPGNDDFYGAGRVNAGRAVQ